MSLQSIAMATALTLSIALAADACTTAIITKGASADGNTYVTHSNDTFCSDPSIVYVPAKDHPKGARRPVYPSAIADDDMPEFNCYTTPRLVAPERSSAYTHAKVAATKPLGYIPQVAHTYAYLDSDYGIMNEKGLMLGECTNEGEIYEYRDPKEGKDLFYASELGRVALERCATAREAIVLMGNLIDTYGLWGTGETLLVADKNEGWVLEMQPNPKGKDFWIAQKVPEGEVFVAANTFRIRDIDPASKEQIFNPSLPAELTKAGYAVMNPATKKIDWVASLKTVEVHPYHGLRRIWRFQQLIAPSQKLPTKVEGPCTQAYPFSVRPDKPLTLQAIMALHRDVYEGTPYDRTQGKLAGLFHSPYRYGSTNIAERSINCQKIGYTWITQSQGTHKEALCYLALNAPRDNVFVPFTVSPMPASYYGVDRRVYDESKMWWQTAKTTELTKGYYSVLSPLVAKKVKELEAKTQQLLERSKNLDKKQLAEVLAQNAKENQKAWEELFPQLLIKLNQGKGVSYPDKDLLKEEAVTEY